MLFLYTHYFYYNTFLEKNIKKENYNAEIGFGFKCWDDQIEYPKIMVLTTKDYIEKGTNIVFIL